MKAKPKKPPIDKQAVRERFDYALAQSLLVTVRRWIPQSDTLSGFVVGIGAKWVAIQRLSDRIEFDGWILMRLRDVQAVSIDPDGDCFEVKALKARGSWPPAATGLPLDDSVEVLRQIGTIAMFSVFDEFARPEVCWIGALTSIDEHKLSLREVNTRGGWARKSRTFDPSDVTRLDFGGGYEEALQLVAGPLPKD